MGKPRVTKLDEAAAAALLDEANAFAYVVVVDVVDNIMKFMIGPPHQLTDELSSVLSAAYLAGYRNALTLLSEDTDVPSDPTTT